jgi:hypothetical protein
MPIRDGNKTPMEPPVPLDWIRTEFNVPASIRKQCDQFFLRVWKGSYVMECIQDGIFYGRFDDWIVHFQSTPEVVRTAKQVACSFREYMGKKYVVVKVWHAHTNEMVE